MDCKSEERWLRKYSTFKIFEYNELRSACLWLASKCGNFDARHNTNRDINRSRKKELLHKKDSGFKMKRMKTLWVIRYKKIKREEENLKSKRKKTEEKEKEKENETRI